MPLRPGRGSPVPVNRAAWSRGAVGLLLLLAVCAGGIVLYLNERDTRQQPVTVGAGSGVRDRVELSADVQRTDPDSRTVTLDLTLAARGRYGDSNGVPAKDITVATDSPDHEELVIRADTAAWRKSITLPLSEGTASDYPFDRYRTDLAVAAMVGREQVPVTLHLRDLDPAFAVDPDETTYTQQVAAVESSVRRSRSTFILAWFMIVAMWAVALAVVVACWLVVRQRRGLVWGALGWMAASLFALVGLRNAAPGSPPNGCILDYAAFYWAEALIALSLTRLVLHGVLVEHHVGGPVPEAPQGPTSSPAPRRPRRVPRGMRPRRPPGA
ncbi:DUF4436 domain-containing protein [Streptomyces triticagri]|uniref:DUF4436 domain-containing protein n=1 Tax=Streptomyces triticagri TaxID=2293568 RepID=A0A372M5A7_9ACTN|nr:DUF4436 family protein [Streptomyces triticagri]RFU86114.1 DUF4436 domain-containing protein [Streptomyces triticagri]